jgi:hypothetical protein
MSPTDPVTFCGQLDDRLKRAASGWILLGQILTACTRALDQECHRERDAHHFSHSGTRLRLSQAMIARPRLLPELTGYVWIISNTTYLFSIQNELYRYILGFATP